MSSQSCFNIRRTTYIDIAVNLTKHDIYVEHRLCSPYYLSWLRQIPRSGELPGLMEHRAVYQEKNSRARCGDYNTSKLTSFNPQARASCLVSIQISRRTL